MQLIINIEKRHLVFLVVLVCVLFVVGVSAYVNPNTGVGHDANETGPGTFGGEVGAVYGFPGLITFPNGAPNNGIFWASSRDTTKPHIDYNSNTGLLISTGNTGKPVNIDGNLSTENVTVSNLMTAKNITVRNITVMGNITIGDNSRGTWPGIIKMEQGVINPGQKVPIPAGYSISDCKWITSINFANMTDVYRDRERGYAGSYTDPDGTVHARFFLPWYAAPWSTYTEVNSTKSKVNYLIICTK